MKELPRLFFYNFYFLRLYWRYFSCLTPFFDFFPHCGTLSQASLVKGASIPGEFLLDLTSLSLAIREFKQAI